MNIRPHIIQTNDILEMVNRCSRPVTAKDLEGRNKEWKDIDSFISKFQGSAIILNNFIAVNTHYTIVKIHRTIHDTEATLI